MFSKLLSALAVLGCLSTPALAESEVYRGSFQAFADLRDGTLDAITEGLVNDHPQETFICLGIPAEIPRHTNYEKCNTQPQEIAYHKEVYHFILPGGPPLKDETCLPFNTVHWSGNVLTLARLCVRKGQSVVFITTLTMQ